MKQRAWMMARLQPYRVKTTDGNPTACSPPTTNPLMDAARQPGNGFNVPIYRLPAGLWRAQALVHPPADRNPARSPGRAAKPRHCPAARPGGIDGAAHPGLGPSARWSPTAPPSLVRVAYAGTNDQPYGSIGRWLLDQGYTRDATWPGIRAWLAANPSAPTS